MLDWVIVGGESGPGARPCDVSWVRSIVQQCQAAGVACFFKQWGSAPMLTLGGVDYRYLAEHADGAYPTWRFQSPDGATFRRDAAGQRLGHYIGLADHKGGNIDEWPADLRVRQMPEVRA